LCDVRFLNLQFVPFLALPLLELLLFGYTFDGDFGQKIPENELN